ncbi:hypothetical protein [Arenimonas daejeonensis]|uniref:hypothetical protein n=1 Tax=Arenimonas daejeonensis TaxID=370777 RepID=UPI0011BDB893|nr:hypothetical protein [Arenimonas daejeonensis]
MRPVLAPLLIALVLPLPPLVAAQEGSPPPSLNKTDREIMSSEAFLGAHPDLKHRLAGLDAYSRGEFETARKEFLRAARYADKPSQGLLGEMHWKGQGAAADRALAYAWMDIAAERAYPMLLIKREEYWAAMTPEERDRAIVVGRDLLDEYGDAAAKPRLEKRLKQARRETTGSRVGSVGNLQIQIPTANGWRTVRGEEYYAETFWKPEQYWQWQDFDWKHPGQGTVEVGDVMTGRDVPPPDADD